MFALRVAPLCVLFSLSQSALASRPMVTDDAAVADAGACQLDAGLYRGPAQAWLTPACNVGGDWEVGIGKGRVEYDGVRHDATAAYVKTVLRPLTETAWGAGMTLSGQRTSGPVPVHDRAVTLLFSAPLGAGLVWHANVGGVRHAVTGQGARTWANALELTRGRAGLSVETFGERRGGRGWQAGASWSAIPNVLDLDIAFSEQRCDGVTTHQATAGLTYTWQR